MILREPTYDDCEFIAECYRDWPLSKRGRIFPVDVRNWIKNYPRYREQGLVGEEDGAKGFLVFEKSFFVAKVHEIVVTPAERGQGYGSKMWHALYDLLSAEGVVVAEFDALPGVVTAKVENGDFEMVSTSVGEQTGLPLVTGRVKAGDL